MNAVRTRAPDSANSFATSPTRRIFYVRSSGEKPRSPLRLWRKLSPSSTYEKYPSETSSFSTSVASVLLPLAERPVNQSTAPRCPRRFSRASRVTALSTHVTFVERCCFTSPVSSFNRSSLASSYICEHESSHPTYDWLCAMPSRRRSGKDPTMLMRIVVTV